MGRQFLFGLVVLLSVACLPSRLAAQASGPYLFVGVSYFWTENADGNFRSANQADETANFDHSDELAYELGVGYNFNDKLSADIAAILVNDIDLTGSYSINGSHIAGSAVSTSIDSLYLFTDAYWTFRSDRGFFSAFSPYVGLGAGVAFHSVDSVSYWVGDTLADSDNTEFAYRLSAGINETFDKLSIGIRYSYIDGGTAESSASGNNGLVRHPEPMKIDMQANVLSFDLSYRF